MAKITRAEIEAKQQQAKIDNQPDNLGWLDIAKQQTKKTKQYPIKLRDRGIVQGFWA